jgi:hypothetical protein
MPTGHRGLDVAFVVLLVGALLGNAALVMRM